MSLEHLTGITKQARACLLVMFASFVLSACASMSPRTGPLAMSAASAGIAATDAALTTYTGFEDLWDREWRSGKTSDLLARPTVDMATLGQIASPPPEQMQRRERRLASISARKEAARNLQETYRAFTRLAEGQFGTDTSAAIQKVNEAVTSLAAARGLPLEGAAPIPGFVGQAAGLIVDAVQAKKLKQHNRILAGLARQFHALWEADLPAWENAVDGAYNMELAQTMSGLPDTAFDAAAVAKLVSEPVSPSLKLRLYRVKLLADAAAEADAAKRPLYDVRKALGSLEDAHTELTKDRPSATDVLNYVERVLELSKSAEEEAQSDGNGK